MSKILVGAMTVQKLMFYSRNKMSKFSGKDIDKISYQRPFIKRWINVFFIALIVGIFFMAGGLYYYTTSYSITSLQIEQGQSSNSENKRVTAIFQRWISVFTILILSAIGMIWYYIQRYILYPLHQMEIAVEHIGHGKLDKTIVIKAPLEMKRLSESINDLSVNLQEILLFVWNQTEISLRCLDMDKDRNHEPKKVIKGINAAKQNMQELQKMVSTFAFYDVRLDQRRVLDGSNEESK
jgi:methyl-accepting chemotaxis protein